MTNCTCFHCKIRKVLKEGGLHLVLWGWGKVREEEHKYPLFVEHFYFDKGLEELKRIASEEDYNNWEEANGLLVEANDPYYMKDEKEELIEKAEKIKDKIDPLILMLLDNFQIKNLVFSDLKIGDNPVQLGGTNILTINNEKK